MRLTASDASFLYFESASGPMHISSVYVLEGELSYDAVFQHFEERIHLVPAYRRKLAQVPFSLGHPKWVDDPDFDLANHVLRHDMPAGTAFEEALDAATTLNEPLLDRSKPLWGVYVISGVPDRTLILQMTHHAMIDGASGIDLTTILYDFEADPKPVQPPAEPWSPAQPPTGAELLSEAIAETMSGFREMNLREMLPSGDQQRRLARQAMQVFANFFTRPAITAPFNASLVGPKRKARYLKKSFGEIREIRRALGGTINDVVLAVVSEAVARYLRDLDEPIDGQHLRIMCPVNVRTEDQQGALGNQVSAIFPMLPAWPMPSLQRLGAVCAETDRIKTQQEAQALTLMSEGASNVPRLPCGPPNWWAPARIPPDLPPRSPCPSCPTSAGGHPTWATTSLAPMCPAYRYRSTLLGTRCWTLSAC